MSLGVTKVYVRIFRTSTRTSKLIDKPSCYAGMQEFITIMAGFHLMLAHDLYEIRSMLVRTYLR